MEDTPAPTKASRRPACDHCKERKTKCDRGDPCSSCSAADLNCRLTRNASTERRQRILISAKYDEAIANIDRQLGQIFDVLQSLGEHNRNHITPSSTASAFTASTKIGIPPTGQATPTSDGFRGEHSFNGQLQDILNALDSVVRPSDSPSHPWNVARSEILSPLAFPPVDATRQTPDTTMSPAPPQTNSSLPPIDMVLNILRLSQVKRQRFFVDVYIVEEADFSELCQQVFFAVAPYTSAVWSIVNTGLLFLLEGLDQVDGKHMGLDPERVVSHLTLLRANVNMAIDDLRVSSEATLRNCQALALLVTYCMKSGQLEKAWRLNCAASRMCLDLGLHRLSGESDVSDPAAKRRVFGYTYIWDKNMAFVLGRPACIPVHEVTTTQPTHADEVPGIPGRVYSKFVDYTFLAAEVQQQLFTAAGQDLPPKVRVEHATRFISRQEAIQTDLRNILRNDADAWGSRMFGAAGLIDISLSFLATILWQILPSDDGVSDGARYHSRCTQAARSGLSTFTKIGETAKEATPRGWGLFGNLILCTTPFVPFLVLVSNAITTGETNDLTLLNSTVDVLKPLSSSPNAGPIYRTCLKLYEAAHSLIASQSSVEKRPFEDRQGVAPEPGSMDSGPMEFDLFTSNFESALVNDWSTFIDLFGGQDEEKGLFGP